MSMLQEAPERAPSLSKAAATCKHLRLMVKECAEGLSSLNVAFRKEIAGRDPRPLIEHTVDESEAIEGKMRIVSEELSAVQRILEREIRGRTMLDHQLAAAVEQEESGRHAAFHDFLTGLPNRALFTNRLEHAFAQAARHGWALAVMFVDLDDFKIINDSYGHEAGDVVLRTIARRLEETARGQDTVSRHGGDEFLCLLTEILDEDSLATIAAKLIQVVRAPCSVDLGDLHISPRVEASIGISIYPKNGSTAERLVRSADEAMYKAKKTKSGYAFAA